MDNSEPFFLRDDVLRAIHTIADQRNLAVYAGAGVTIDRSGLTWKALIRRLLQTHVSSDAALDRFLDDEGPAFAASAAHFLFGNANDTEDKRLHNIDTRQRMVDVLRVALYSPGTWRTGDLALSIADLAYAWNTQNSKKRRSACVVTTNYDDYIYQALETARRERSRQRPDGSHPRPSLWFPTDADPLAAKRAQLAKWVKKFHFEPDDVPCIHLHGYVPRNPLFSPGEQRRFPVISEDDYFRTAPYSEKALVSLLRKRSMIIVGASITDPPLIRALEATLLQADRYPRWALVPLPPPFPGGDLAAFSERQRLIGARLESLRLIPIFVDFYTQLAQFFREVTYALAEPGTEDGLTDDRASQSSYYRRLSAWWSELNLDDPEFRDDTQFTWHDYLVEVVLPNVRDTLGAPNSEIMKLEFWIRWEPTKARELRLFASSMGVWRNYDAMRVSSISIDGTQDPVAEAFRSGSPALIDPSRGDSSGGLDEKASTRWQSSLVVPVRYYGGDEGGNFTSGVFVLSSMTDAAQSCLSESRDRSKLAKAVRELMSIGDFMCDPA